MNHLHYKYLSLVFAMLLLVMRGNGQTTIPPELTKNPIKEQIKFIEERTRIYENYRAIREDMFQTLKGNILDSVSAGEIRITRLKKLVSTIDRTYDSLNILLGTTRESLDEITTTKNSISVLGMEINKVAYNTTMWIIVSGLIVVLTIGFLAFKRSLSANIRNGKELEELKSEFEAYRQSARIAREKMTMDHFNEIKKLKGT